MLLFLIARSCSDAPALAAPLIGDPFPIAVEAVHEVAPAVAFNRHPMFRDFLVVWEDGRDDPIGSTTRWGVWAQRVSGSGAGGPLVGSPLAVADAGPGGVRNTDPDVAYNLGRNEYLVVDTHAPAGGPMTSSDLYGRRVTGDGGLLAEQVVDDSTADQYGAAVASYAANATAPYLVSTPTPRRACRETSAAGC